MYNKNVTLTTMFYIGNMLHDIFYNLGFDEVKGNFQENNFGKGGRGNDAMIINAYIDECSEDQKKIDEICTINYPYTTASVDSIPPVIFLPKVQNSHGKGGGIVSSGIINHYIIHEYTHGVTGRLGGGPNYDCGLVFSVADYSALNEGYSDFFSAALQYDMKRKVDRNSDLVLDRIKNGENIINLGRDLTYSDLQHMMKEGYGAHYEGNIWRTI